MYRKARQGVLSGTSTEWDVQQTGVDHGDWLSSGLFNG
jgi:hypothetical protein